MPAHHYVILRRVERAKELLHGVGDLLSLSVFDVTRVRGGAVDRYVGVYEHQLPPGQGQANTGNLSTPGVELQTVPPYSGVS